MLVGIPGRLNIEVRIPRSSRRGINGFPPPARCQQERSERPDDQYSHSHPGSSTKIGGQNLSNGTASERIGKDADYNRLRMRYGSAASARRAASALFVGNGFAIAAASSVGYLGFLVGPPVVGSVSGVLGQRMALALVVIAGLIIAISAREVMAEAGS
jgi:hypothetical protein